jgi:mycothiol synthase
VHVIEVQECEEAGSPLLDAAQKGDAVHGVATLVARPDPGAEPVGCARVSRGRAGWAIEYEAGGDVAGELVQAAVDVVRVGGGGHVQMWVNRPTEADDAVAADAGLAPRRDLYQLRIDLPRDEPYELDTRAFVAGQDEEAWLEVNNRAFDWHPDQGGWDIETLRARQQEPWFEPEGFLLHEIGGRLAGFCWTKVHADHDPPLGEIYVIATDPDFQGKGLGRRLVLAGLDHLSRKGLRTGMLYVDAANAPAVHLYEDMGFHVDHIDRAYAADIAP